DGSLRHETEWLLARGATKALKIIGYGECAEALQTGDWAAAEERTNARTRQYAKRQRSWFAKDAGASLQWPFDALRLCEQAAGGGRAKSAKDHRLGRRRRGAPAGRLGRGGGAHECPHPPIRETAAELVREGRGRFVAVALRRAAPLRAGGGVVRGRAPLKASMATYALDFETPLLELETKLA